LRERSYYLQIRDSDFEIALHLDSEPQQVKMQVTPERSKA